MYKKVVNTGRCWAVNSVIVLVYSIFIIIINLPTILMTLQQVAHLIPDSATRRRQSTESSFDSIINELSLEESKFCSQFIENWQLFNTYVSSFEIVQPHHLFGQKFIVNMKVYRIKVITDHICYVIEKRYRDFLDLYNKVSQFYTPITVFPKKTHFRSKICPLLTEGRKKTFDNFMEQLISMRTCNKTVVSQFILFLNLKEHYMQKQLDQSIFQVGSISEYLNKKPNLFSHIIKHQLLKINVKPNQSTKYLQNIEEIISHANRNMVKLDDLKTLLLGSGINKQGLIEISFSTANQFVGLTFLKYIKKILSPQSSNFCESFKKIFQSAPPKFFGLQHQQILKNEEFSSTYFEILDCYIKLRMALDHETTFQILIHQIMKPSVIKMFIQWKTDRNTVQTLKRRKTLMEMKAPTKVSVDTTDSVIQSKGSGQLEDIEPYLDHKAIFAQKIISINRRQKENNFKNLIVCDNFTSQVCQQGKFLYFNLKTHKKLEEIRDSLRKWIHNAFVSSCYQKQKLTNICKVFFNFEGKSQKVFHFYQQEDKNEEDKQNSQYRRVEITFSPPENLKNVNSFFLYTKATEMNEDQCEIQLLYYFHSSKIRNFFKNHFQEENNRMQQRLFNLFLPKSESKQKVNAQDC